LRLPSLNPSSRPLDQYGMLRNLKGALALGLLFIIVYSLRFWHAPATLALILGVGVLGAGASLFSGFLLGFIFGIPRTPRTEPQQPASPQSTSAPAATGPQNAPAAHAAAGHVEPNSNLVEISDWLTKIFVGVGLVELAKIPVKMQALAAYFAKGLRDCSTEPCAQSSESFAMAIIIFYAVCGFLIAYLWARLYLQRAFGELSDLREEVSEATTWIYIVFARVLTGLGTWLHPKPPQIDPTSFQLALSGVKRGLAKYPLAPELHREMAYLLKAFATRESPPNAVLIGEALSHVQLAASLRPDDAVTIYNLACYQFLLKEDTSTVLANLKRAIELQPSLRSTAATDPDLAGLRGNPVFDSLVPPPAGNVPKA
jgi:hypothetical protein